MAVHCPDHCIYVEDTTRCVHSAAVAHPVQINNRLILPAYSHLRSNCTQLRTGKWLCTQTICIQGTPLSLTTSNHSLGDILWTASSQHLYVQGKQPQLINTWLYPLQKYADLSDVVEEWSETALQEWWEAKVIEWQTRDMVLKKFQKLLCYRLLLQINAPTANCWRDAL